MSNIYEALKRNLFLAPAGAAFRGYMDKLNQEEKDKELMNAIFNAGKTIDEGFEPRPNQTKLAMTNNTLSDPFLTNRSPMARELMLNNITSQPDKTVDYEYGRKNSLDAVYNYLTDAMSKGVETGKIDQGLQALKFKSDKYTQPKKDKKEDFTLDQGDVRYGYDKDGNLVKLADNPKKETQPEKFKNFSAKGYWDTSDPKNPKWVENKKYKPDTAGSDEDERKDYSPLLGKLDEGLSKVNEVLTPTKKGEYFVPTSGGEFQLVDYDSARKYAENLKNQYKDDATTIVHQQGLLNAVEMVRDSLKKGKSLKDTLKKFKAANPDLSKDQETILKTYFELFTK